MPEHAQDPRRPDIGGLRTPPVEEWDSWPFAGGVTPKTLRAPEPEPDRDGEGARPCTACGKGDDEYIWTDERWRLQSFPPSGLPAVLILEPRAHVDGPRDLPDDMLAEMGIMLARVERAVLADRGRRARPHPPLRRGRRAPALVVHGPADGPTPDGQWLRDDLGRRAAADPRGRPPREHRDGRRGDGRLRAELSVCRRRPPAQSGTGCLRRT